MAFIANGLTMFTERPFLNKKDGARIKMRKVKLDRRLKLAIQSLPLVAIVGSSFLPVQRLGQQFLVLITLIWIQVFFLVECILVGK